MFLRKLSEFVLDDVTAQNAVVFIDSSLNRPTSQYVKRSFATGFPEPCLCVLQRYSSKICTSIMQYFFLVIFYKTVFTSI